MTKAGLGIGLIAALLVPLALLLFEALTAVQTVSAILLLGGSWTLVFGVFLGSKDERLYYSGFGVVVVLLSTFLFIPFRFTAGLVLVAIVALAVVSVVLKPGAPHPPKP